VTCLGVVAQDRVAVVRDRDRADIADAIEEQVRLTGAELRSWVMEDLGPRPLTSFPRGLADELLRYQPTASFFVGGTLPGEIAFRMPLVQLLNHQLKARHGHMVNAERRLMLQGMSADYEQVYRVTRAVYEAVRHASRIEVGTSLGTELTATFTSSHRWVPCDARYHEQGRWGNLPEGEVFTAPLSVDGLLVGEEMGDSFDARYGVFEEPVRLRVKEGRVTSVEMPGTLRPGAEIRAYFARHPCSGRVGEFAIGTNVGLAEIIGNFTQDEKFPGVHVAFGNPYGEETGADWDCPTHVDVLASHATVSVDGRRIMEDGRILV